MTERVELKALYPDKKGEDNAAYTGRLLSHAREHGTNRQCSIGWHEECSDPYGESCMCLCHGLNVTVWSVEGYPHEGSHMVTRVEEGQQRWPAQPDEPEGMWAYWLLATSENDARFRAINMAKAQASA